MPSSPDSSRCQKAEASVSFEMLAESACHLNDYETTNCTSCRLIKIVLRAFLFHTELGMKGSGKEHRAAVIINKEKAVSF